MLFPTRQSVFNVFDDVFNDPFFRNQSAAPMAMKTDIQEIDGNYVLDMDLPGFNKENISAEVENGYLTIFAKKVEEKKEEEKGKIIHQERYSGQCKRSFYIGSNLKAEDIKAGYKDGILKLIFPKEEQRKSLPEKELIAIE